MWCKKCNTYGGHLPHYYTVQRPGLYQQDTFILISRHKVAKTKNEINLLLLLNKKKSNIKFQWKRKSRNKSLLQTQGRETQRKQNTKKRKKNYLLVFMPLYSPNKTKNLKTCIYMKHTKTIIFLNELYILAAIVLISSIFSKATMTLLRKCLFCLLSWAHYVEEFPI